MVPSRVMRLNPGPLQTSAMELFAKILSKVNLPSLTIVAKRSALDALQGPEYASTSGYNNVLKIQTEIPP